MKLVIVESPLRGDYEYNRRYAKACLKDCIARGEAPLASHLLYAQPGILDDSILAERNLGIKLGLAWAKAADYVVVYNDLGMSPGMLDSIEHHLEEGRQVVMRFLGQGWNNGADK